MNKLQKKQKNIDFQYACGLGNIKEVYSLIENNNIDIKCNNNNAIKWAIINNHTEIVKFLINKGASENNSKDLEKFCKARKSNNNILNLFKQCNKLLNF
jgi:ankyrin repeat protein